MAENAVNFGAYQDTSMLDEMMKRCRDGITDHASRLCDGHCKSMDDYRYSVGYIAAMRAVIMMPSDIHKASSDNVNVPLTREDDE